jgi:hypothetical protein
LRRAFLSSSTSDLQRGGLWQDGTHAVHTLALPGGWAGASTGALMQGTAILLQGGCGHCALHPAKGCQTRQKPV